MEGRVILVSKERKEGSSDRGNWFFQIYTDTTDKKYQTDFNKSVDLPLNRPVDLIWEIVERGKFKNNVIRSYSLVEESPDTHEAPPQAHDAPAPAQDRPVRSHETNRSDALARAIEAHNAGFAKSASAEQLYRVADEFVRYIEQGSGAFQKTEDDGIPF